MGAVHVAVVGYFLFYFSNFGLISFPLTYSFICAVLVHCACHVVCQAVSLWQCKFSMNFPMWQYWSSVRFFVEGVCNI
jgi:hypothetical protein